MGLQPNVLKLPLYKGFHPGFDPVDTIYYQEVLLGAYVAVHWEFVIGCV